MVEPNLRTEQCHLGFGRTGSATLAGSISFAWPVAAQLGASCRKTVKSFWTSRRSRNARHTLIPELSWYQKVASVGFPSSLMADVETGRSKAQDGRGGWALGHAAGGDGSDTIAHGRCNNQWDSTY